MFLIFVHVPFAGTETRYVYPFWPLEPTIKKVFRTNVTMHKPLGVQHLQPLKHLSPNLESPFEAKFSLLLDEEPSKGRSKHLHHHIVVLPITSAFYDLRHPPVNS